MEKEIIEFKKLQTWKGKRMCEGVFGVGIFLILFFRFYLFIWFIYL